MGRLSNSKNQIHDEDELIGDVPPKKRWLKRFGIGAFLFFLIKGLIWVGVAVAALMGIKGC